MKKIVITMLAIAMCIVPFSGCKGQSAPPAETSTPPASTSESTEPAAKSETPAEANRDVADILGPNGESGVAAADVTPLTAEEIQKIKDGKYKAAICMHYGGNDWSTAQINGIKAGCEELGIEVVAVTDANFSSEQQISDVETVMASKPDIIFAMPTEPEAVSDIFKRASDAGITLVFMDQRPTGLTPGEDYVGIVSSDNWGNGIAAARIMGDALNGKGEVVQVYYYDLAYFACNQRDEAFLETIKNEYPGITVIDRYPVDDPNSGADIAEAMLTKYPNLSGMYFPYDVPAVGAASGALAMGREDLVITSVDLGMDIATIIATGGPVKGVSAQYPFDQGKMQSIVAAYGLLGKQIDPFIVVAPATVTSDNVLDIYSDIYHVDPPKALVDAYNSAK